MSAMPGKDFLEKPSPGVKELAGRYAALLDLYREMENVSERVFLAFEETAAPNIIIERIQEKKEVAERIIRESHDIAALKQRLAETGGISREDRELVIEMEERLTGAVNRMVEREDKGRDLVMRRGVRVARR